MYIAVGIGIIVLMIVLICLDTFTPFSEFMSSFKSGTYKKLLIGLSIAACLSLTYGIYHALTYQPPFIDIETSDGSRTVFGDIGTMGYYADGLVHVDQPAVIHLVAWETLDIGDDTTITVRYPSGTETIWQTAITSTKNRASKNMQAEYDVKGIYELEPYTFSESGKVDLVIDDDQTVTIDVKEE